MQPLPQRHQLPDLLRPNARPLRRRPAEDSRDQLARVDFFAHVWVLAGIIAAAERVVPAGQTRRLFARAHQTQTGPTLTPVRQPMFVFVSIFVFVFILLSPDERGEEGAALQLHQHAIRHPLRPAPRGRADGAIIKELGKLGDRELV